MSAPSLGFVIGATENSVPPGASIRELKFCENCPRLFARDKGSRRKFCAECCGHMLMPVDDTEYRETLPQIPRRSYDLIHYDDSLTNPRREYKPRKDTGIKVSSSEWKRKVIAAFEERGQLSGFEIDEIIGNKNAMPGASRCQSAGLELQRIGFVKREPGRVGRMPGIYILITAEIH